MQYKRTDVGKIEDGKESEEGEKKTEEWKKTSKTKSFDNDFNFSREKCDQKKKKKENARGNV